VAERLRLLAVARRMNLHVRSYELPARPLPQVVIMRMSRIPREITFADAANPSMAAYFVNQDGPGDEEEDEEEDDEDDEDEGNGEGYSE
jgi:hypothetical protein